MLPSNINDADVIYDCENTIYSSMSSNDISIDELKKNTSLPNYIMQ